MRWTSWLPRSRSQRLSVVGLDMGPDACSLVVLTGSKQSPDSVCCSERLTLPAGLMAQGDVLQSEALGQWLRAYLAAGDYQPEMAYVGLDSACVSNHLVTLNAGLSPEDVAFQLLVEVQAVLPEHAVDVCIDYTLDTEPVAVGQQRYVVQAVSRVRVEAVRRAFASAGLKLVAVESRHDAAHRTRERDALMALPQASAALALQCDEAFGLALRAWCEGGMNFLSRREDTQHVLRRAWLLGMAVCAMGGAFLAAGFAVVMASAAERQRPSMDEVRVSTRALDEAQKAHDQVKAQQERGLQQSQWLKTRQALQAQSLQWGQVLSQSTQGIWVSSVKQQGTRWTVQGEALSSGHAQQLVAKLRALDIWAQAPALPQLQVVPAVASKGLPVWQFRIEADLKAGV